MSDAPRKEVGQSRPALPEDTEATGAKAGAAQDGFGPRVVDAEVLAPGREQSRGRDSRHDANAQNGFGHDAFRNINHGNPFGMGGEGFGRIWSVRRTEQNACLAPCVTFALFLVCLAQFGLLAGIGFAVFHTLGSLLGFLRQMRGLAEGRIHNPWPWRLGNWLVSFLLTVWLAGGFD